MLTTLYLRKDQTPYDHELLAVLSVLFPHSHLHGSYGFSKAFCLMDFMIETFCLVPAEERPLSASTVASTAGDSKQFKNGLQFAAWLGLTPRQNSSGGKSSLGSITKRGDNYLRTLLIPGAQAVVLTGKYNLDPISQWAISLRQRSGWQKAVVALANKNARILWALMTHQRSYEASHISTRASEIVT